MALLCRRGYLGNIEPEFEQILEISLIIKFCRVM